ncbi:unnamed protein product [Tuber melanosporum]|uniref:(Perigord truffle) hypothetical protein n=1 Tax=Tuber melanosporum (strain Mel28) TaxID=656061 RepID=D5GED3_TUBMM|nr:uncharacterized protein GSTUM_00001275001 [Tuber melanosporum]CAZ82876.1 unnamed protein product [Tuber melanosporum]
MVSSNSTVDSAHGPQKMDHSPAEHNEPGDSREETGAPAGPSDKQKSLVVKLPLPKLSQPKENPPVIDLTDPTPEPQSINPSPNPESAATNLREAQKTKQTSPEPSVMPAKTPKPEIILAEQPVSHIRRSIVGRRSRYNPDTIVMDLLRTIGRHPTLPALNSGLEVLKDTLPNYFSGPVDLTTVRWDILDPPPPFAHNDETEDEAEILHRSLGAVGVGGGLVGVVASPAPAPRKRGRKKKGDVASSVPGHAPLASTGTPFPRPRGRPRKGTSITPIRSTIINVSGDAGGPSNKASFTQPTGASVSGAGVPGEGPSPRIGSSEAGGRQRASVGASGLRNVSTPSGSSIAVLIPPLSGASKSEYLTTPSNDRKRKSEERAEGGRAGKTPKLSVKSRSQKSGRPEPSGFKIFECRWKHCRARLHNFENLRKHVFKAHKKLTTYNAYACLWASCHREPPEEMKKRAIELGTILPDKISHDFKIGEEWEAHIDENHLAQVKEELGLGPAVLPSDCESGISDVDYMSDRDGHPVTPLAVLAPPGYRFTPPPGFPVNPQFRLAHGLPTPPARRRRNATGREGALGVVRNLAAGSSDPEKPDDDDDEGWKADQIPVVEEEDVQMREGN